MSAPIGPNSIIVPQAIWARGSIEYGREVAAAMCDRFDLLSSQVEVIALSTGLLVAQSSPEGVSAPELVRGNGDTPSIKVEETTYSTDHMGGGVYEVITEHIMNRRKGTKPKNLPIHMDSAVELRGGVPGFTGQDFYPKTETFLWANTDGTVITAYTKYGRKQGGKLRVDEPHHDVRFRPAVFIPRKTTSLLEV